MRITRSGFVLNDRKGWINAFLSLQPVLLSLGSQVIDVIEHDLVEVANSGVEVTWDGDVED